MAVVTGDFAAGLFTTFQVIWQTEFLAAEMIANYPRFCMTAESDTAQESYNWLANPPAMRAWVGSRVVQDVPAFNYTIVNLLWEDTVAVKRTALEDDKYGAIRPMIAQLGQEASRFVGYQASLSLANGTSRACYDGSNFYDTTHTEGGSGTQSNKLTGSGASTLAQLRTDFVAARTAMRRFKDAAARPMNIQPDLVVAPPELQDLFEQLLSTNFYPAVFGSNTAAAAPSNNLKGAADVMIDANLTDTNDWHLMSTAGASKPLIYQHRSGPEFDARDNPATSDVVFDRDELLYGARARFNFGYGRWSRAVLTTNT